MWWLRCLALFVKVPALVLIFFSRHLLHIIWPLFLRQARRLAPFVPPSGDDNRNNSTSSSSPASDHDALPPKYNVFISFRGGDVRNSFLSHLYSYLHNYKKLWTYKDDVDLERGLAISPALLQAIEASAVYIVIFSLNYADSPWCLEELETIVQCGEKFGRRVIPVFYDGVDPLEVETLTGSCGAAFSRLPAEASGKKPCWTAALSKAAAYSGFDSRVERPETVLIQKITKAVFQAIHNQTMPDSYSFGNRGNSLVGVEKRVNQIQPLLCLEGSEHEHDNLTIGIWGMPGIGKTVLAEAIYNKFSSQFEARDLFCDFAKTVSESKKQPFDDFQNDFFAKLLRDENPGRVRDPLKLLRLSRTKVLAVIDDVGDGMSNIEQLNNLLNGRYCDMFGPGSRLVIVSRNKQVLSNVCHHVYEVPPLKHNEALRLFCLHAFKLDCPPIEYEWLCRNAISYSGGNPLALIVLGSRLYGRDQTFWDNELNGSDRAGIQSVLRRSYDGLNQAEKSAFLDIACFKEQLHWWKLEEIEGMLLDGGYAESGGSARNVFTNLSDLSLLRIHESHDGVHVAMHRLLQDFGRGVVSEERRVGKRSRLWEAKDIYHLLRYNKGTDLIEAIIWDLSKLKYEIKKINMAGDTFTKMYHLRFLVIRYGGETRRPLSKQLVIADDGLLQSLPTALKCLHWEFFPARCLASEFFSENLVSLDLPNSNVEQLWKGEHDYVDLRNLEFLNLEGSERLKKLPDLSTAKRLKRVKLGRCETLVELPVSILELPKLEEIDVSECKSLGFNNLNLHCTTLTASILLPNLKLVLLSGTMIQSVPDFLPRTQISELHCYSCSNLTEFPVIPSVEILNLGNTAIEGRIELGFLPKLEDLNLTANQRVIHLSDDICKLQSFRRLNLSGCTQLEEFPDILQPMKCMDVLSLSGCAKLSTLPGSIGKLVGLGVLDLSNTAVTELPSSIMDLKSLLILKLQRCKSLASLPSNICNSRFLSSLDVGNCCRLSSLPELPPGLAYMNAYGCQTLEMLSGVEKHDHRRTKLWNFGKCPKLDRDGCTKLVRKFTHDVVDFTGEGSRSVIIPAEWNGDEARMVSSTSSSSLLQQPWEAIRGVMYSALLELSPADAESAGIATSADNVLGYHVDCWLRSNVAVAAEILASRWQWYPQIQGGDIMNVWDGAEHRCQRLNGLLIWSDGGSGWKKIQQFAQGQTSNADGSGCCTGYSDLEFSFRAEYRSSKFTMEELPNLIKRSRLVPVFCDNRVVDDRGGHVSSPERLLLGEIDVE
ncbi:unnamed protein product [Linum trigynum]|uniref:TIR domain-containing protein n=1 Tax=Linum trigynum TaxID=586398 RepID=A0AAV2FZQ0_9ROSI